MKLEATQIAKILKEHICEQKTFFVFSTDVTASSWLSWCAKEINKNEQIFSISAERFIAWDKFKSKYIKLKEKDCKPIPSQMRKIFTNDLLRRNKTEHFLKKIINPIYAENGLSFVDWISSNLMSLKVWADKGFDLSDEEESDYCLIFNEYKSFLEKNNFFEQSWIAPDFLNTDEKFIVFYPETYEDFCEYQMFFDSSKNIQCVHVQPMKNEEDSPKLYYYSDSRREIRKTILYIRKLRHQGIDWNEIALHIPDLETIRPYLERELKNYEVPTIFHAGTPLTSCSAGQIFSLIQDCFQSDFSYNSIRALVLNGYIPWSNAEIEINGKKTQRDLCTDLVRFGQENHCICSYTKKTETEQGIVTQKKISTWEESFSKSDDELLFNFYKNLKKQIESICKTKSFEDLKKSWFIFLEGNGSTPLISKEKFKLPQFEESDKILGRCIRELEKLIVLEKLYLKHGELKIENIFSFYINELNKIVYAPQPEKIDAVNVYKYKNAAAAAFNYNFILNCSQTAISVSSKPLNFLSEQKRFKLGIKDYDSTKSFISLYAATGTSISSCAERSFSGYAIPHSSFKICKQKQNEKLNDQLKELDFEDFIICEGKNIRNKIEAKELTENQVLQFNNWKAHSNCGTTYKEKESSNLLKTVTETVENKYCAEKSDLPRITQSDLANFFPCPRNWLFRNVLKIKEDDFNTELMDKYETGNILHSIMDFLLKKWQEPAHVFKTVLPLSTENGFSHNLLDAAQESDNNKNQIVSSIILNDIEECFFNTIETQKYNRRTLVKDILISQKNNFCKTILSFLSYFCSSSLFGNWRIVATEKQLFFTPDGKEYSLYGKIDCLLKQITDEGEEIYAIVDYKTTALPKGSEANACLVEKNPIEVDELKNFQLALYKILVDNNKMNAQQGAFISIKNKKDETIFYPDSNTKKNTKATEFTEKTIPVFFEYSDYFSKKLKSMSFEPFKKEKIITDKNKFYQLDEYSDCSNCSYKTICRTTFSISENKLQ